MITTSRLTLRGVSSRTAFLSSAAGPASSAASSSSSSQKAAQQQTSSLSDVVCLECGGKGHKAKECPKAAGTAKRNVQDLFREGRCLLCGEVGHEAKHCPKVGGAVEESRPLAPRQPKPTLAERNAHKTCLQCGEKGHVMRDCPTNPNTVKIKGIKERYSGSRLQKMLPELLKEERTIDPAHESFANVAPKLGVVVSTLARKTIGVLVDNTHLHPKLKINIDRSRKFLVHDEEEKAVCGDVVLIQQTRPITRNKNFTLREIVLSHNNRLDSIATKVQEAKKVYEGIDDEALKTLDKLREKHMARMAQLKKVEVEELQQVRSRIQTELNERLKDVNLIADDIKKEAQNSPEWLQQMKRKLETKDQWAQAVVANGKGKQ